MDEHRAIINEVLCRYVDKLGNFISRYIPEGREKSIAITKLQECQMWAMNAVVSCEDVCDVAIRGAALKMDEEEPDA